MILWPPRGASPHAPVARAGSTPAVCLYPSLSGAELPPPTIMNNLYVGHDVEISGQVIEANLLEPDVPFGISDVPTYRLRLAPLNPFMADILRDGLREFTAGHELGGNDEWLMPNGDLLFSTINKPVVSSLLDADTIHHQTVTVDATLRLHRPDYTLTSYPQLLFRRVRVYEDPYEYIWEDSDEEPASFDF